MFGKFSLAAMIALVVLCPDPASAQVMPTDVRALRYRLRAADTPPERVSRLFSQLLDARRSLMAGQPDHEDLIFWRTAQAEDALLEGLAINALGLSVRHGLSDARMRQAVVDLIEEAQDNVAQVEVMLPAALATAAGSRLARLESLHDSRLPMLLGLSLALSAELCNGSDADEQRGIELMEAALPTLRGKDAVTLARHLALALVRAGRIDEADKQINELLHDERGSPIDRVGLRLAQVEVRAATDGPAWAAGQAQLVAATNGVPLERLLLIEQAARNWMIASRNVQGDTPEAIQERQDLEVMAVDAFLLLRPEQGGIEFGEDDRVLDLMIEERLGRLGVADPTAAHLSTGVTVAAAQPLAGSPDTAATARAMLEPLVNRPGISPRARARVLAVLVHADVQDGDRPAAIEHAVQWSQVAADRPEAHAAADLAATIARQYALRRPDDEAAQEGLDRAISNILVHFGDHKQIDLWRWRAGQQAEQAGRFAAARKHYEDTSVRSEERSYAMARLALLSVRKAAEAAPADRAAAITQARQDIGELKESIAHQEGRHPQAAALANVGLDLAAARLALLEGRPVEALDRLSKPISITLDAATAREIHVARVEAALRTERAPAVQAVLDTIPDDVVDDVARVVLPQMMRIPGFPLPLDPLVNANQKVVVLKMARVLATQTEQSRADEMLIIEGLRRGGAPSEALVRLEVVLGASPNLADAIMSQAECLRVIPDSDRAGIIANYIRLTRGDPDPNPARFWSAQVRLLEAMRDDAQDPAEILARLNRLKRVHPDLGGPPWDGQFAVLRGQLVAVE